MANSNSAASAACDDARPIFNGSALSRTPAIGQMAERGARFVAWRLEDSNRKVPLQPNGKLASSTGPETWAPLDDCLAAVDRLKAAGVGFVLALRLDEAAGHAIIAVIDLDNAIDPATGAIRPWALEVVRDCNTYTETSPSGAGLKIYGIIDRPIELAASKLVLQPANGSKAQQIEVFLDKRFLALTGAHLDGTPDELVDITEAFERLAYRLNANACERAKDLPKIKLSGVVEPSGQVKALIRSDPAVTRLWAGVKRGGDTTASGLDASLALALHRRGCSQDEIEGVLRTYKHGQVGGGKLTGKMAERRLQRLIGFAVAAEQEHDKKPKNEAQAEATTDLQEEPWPAPLAEEAFHGIAGEIVRKIEPHSEADPAALLFQTLAALGSILGAGSYVRVEGDRHPPRLFMVQVGRTSKGRKGTSWGRVRELLEQVAPEWLKDRVASGLSSGEGLLHEVRDPVMQTETDRKTGARQEVCVDPGVSDKRLLVMEAEFAKPLRAMERAGNSLSPVLRDAWDRGDLRTLVKTSPGRATGAHIAVIGHITADELRRYLDRTEAANGFANRFMFVCVQRSKRLPRGGGRIDWSDIASRLRHAFAAASNIGEVHRTDAAWEIWESVYDTLSDDRPGMLGAILGRAEAQVLRLALVYALLDGSAFIDAEHMAAALACWDYAETSVRHIFGQQLGDPTADEILRLIRELPNGITRTELMVHFAKHKTSAELSRALALLVRDNLIVRTLEDTGGRPAERWRVRT
jgi:hypothetical protein